MKTSAPNLKVHFSYRKFKSPPFRFLFITYDFFLQDALIKELQLRGHEVHTLAFAKGIPVDKALRTLLQKAVEVRPDAVFTLNALGMDDQGHVISVLSDLNLPVVIWYLDNHLFTGPHLQGRSPDWAIAFTYERALESILRDAGFQHVFYLPLATDLRVPDAGSTGRFDFLRDKVSYVGGLFTDAINDYFQPEFEKLYDAWQPDFSTRKQSQGRIDLRALFAPYRDQFSTPEELFHFMAYVIARETRRYRVDRMARLQSEPLVIFGPPQWKEHLAEPDIRPPVDYRTETPLVYNCSAVNLSLTTLQQETALNQRYYDVPACGGFLLGEWQESLAEHFDPQKEAVTFRTDEELRDKVRYVLAHPEERQRIVMKAKERIMKEHLVEHRVSTMLECVRKVCA